MFKIIIAGILSFSAMGLNRPVNDEILKEIRAKASWTAHDVETNPLRHHDSASIRKLLGTIPAGPLGLNAPEDTGVTVPATFNANDKWTNCAQAVRNQQQCGSCWAFGAAEALSARFCIAGDDVVLSTQELVSCDHSDMGCNGGYLNKAWDFLEKNGTPKDSAYPYVSGSGVTGTCK